MISWIYNLVIGPIELIIEIIFGFLLKVVHDNYGFAVIGISIVVSYFCLPLYLKAEKIQEKERLLQRKMSRKIAVINRNFKKDERYMLLSAYYRQNRYHPVLALRSSLSLLIQIPFFIAAYHFLSHFEALRGESFLAVGNLGAPDALLSIASFQVNILPVAMTAINIVSGIIYTKGFPFREKAQLYAMALFFLVILYNSPSALVIYWTCNNIFSLVKNAVLKAKKNRLVFYVITAFLLACLCVYVIFFRTTGRSNQTFFSLLALGFSFFVLFVPFLVVLVSKWGKRNLFFLKNENRAIRSLFLVSALGCGVLCGLFIPFNTVASDPAAFSFINGLSSPFNIIAAPVCILLGLFIFWPAYIFFLGSKKARAVMSFLAAFLLIYAAINIFLFSGKYGMVSQTFTFFRGTDFTLSKSFLILNIISGIAVFCAVFMLFRFNKLRIITIFCFTILFSSSLFSLIKARGINNGFLAHKSIVENNMLLSKTSPEKASGEIPVHNGDLPPLEPEISLSRNGQNVFVIMLDKAAGSYFPAILNERSELKSAFDGFTYYPNTVSYFRATLLGAPPLFGGYEYTPDKLHERKDESMRKKYNEACLVLPTFFRQKGFSASVFDLPYFDFQSRMNISLFSDRGIKAANFGNKFARRFFSEFKDRASPISGRVELLIRHNLVLFSVFMASPVFLRTIIYDNGNYWSAVDNVRLDIVLGTVSDNYSLLYYLPEITAVNNEEKNTFSLFVSNMAHDPSFLQYPDYTVVSEISDFGPDLFNGNIKSFQFYHVNAASYILLAKWFEFLKKQGVYDNTRIIIVSDHGESLVDPSGAIDRAYTPYNPILLFKDFNAKGELKTDFEFMTNADTPLLAVKDIFPGAKNPFTGKLFEADKENGVFVFLDGSSQPQDYPGNEVLDKTSHFYHIKENIFDAKNWTKTTKKY